MDDWTQWSLPDDPEEMVRHMRDVLADPHHSPTTKAEALELLTNLADESAVELLRWYQAHAERGMALTAQLALIEAKRLLSRPTQEAWHDELIRRIEAFAQRLYAQRGGFPPRRAFAAALADALRHEGWQVATGGQALLLMDRHLLDVCELEMVVNSSTLVGTWDHQAAERAWREMEEDEVTVLDPLDQFYATLRSSNLPWGLLIDISDRTPYVDLIQNLDVDRGLPAVSYLVRFPDDAPLAIRSSN